MRCLVHENTPDSTKRFYLSANIYKINNRSNAATHGWVFNFPQNLINGYR